MPRSFIDGKLTASPPVTQNMYLWRRRATPKWWTENEERLRDYLGTNLVLIEWPNRKRLQIEFASESRHALRAVTREARALPGISRRPWYRVGNSCARDTFVRRGVRHRNRQRPDCGFNSD